MKSLNEHIDVAQQHKPVAAPVLVQDHKDQVAIGLNVMQRHIAENKKLEESKEEPKQLRAAYSVLG